MTTLRKHTSAVPLPVPFISTPPLWDVKWLLLLLPLWWFLGIEQFIWVALLTLSAAKVVVLQQGRVHVPTPLKLLAAFVLVYLISGLFIVESFRYVTFARNFLTVLSAFWLFFVVVNQARSWADIDGLLKAILAMLAFAGVFGLLGLLDIWRPSVQSLMGQVLPGWITSTDYGSQIAFRAVGRTGWFVGLGQYFRVRSLFLFPTLYASALIYGLPFALFKFERLRGWRRLLVGGLIVLLLVNLIFTTARTALVALIAGGIYYALFAGPLRQALRVLAGLLTLLLVVAFLSTLYVESITARRLAVTEAGTAVVETFLLARGGGSFADRLTVYEGTLNGVLERPFFGWGTERDIEGVDLPAGSHNEYLAVLYRQGLVGITIHVALLLVLWRQTRPPRPESHQDAVSGFLQHGRWFFVTAVLNSIATVPLLDMTAMAMLWLLFALLIVARRLHDAQEVRAA